MPVKLGVAASVTAVPAEKVELLVEKQQRGDVTVEVKLDESVAAPVSQGQRIGTMTVRCGEQILAQVPMVAKEAVARLSWWQIFSRVMRQIAMGR